MDDSPPQSPLSMVFSRQEYWNGLPYPPPGDLPNPGIEPRSPTLQVDSSLSETSGKLKNTGVGSLSLLQGIFLTQELKRGLLLCTRVLYQLSYQGSPAGLGEQLVFLVLFLYLVHRNPLLQLLHQSPWKPTWKKVLMRAMLQVAEGRQGGKRPSGNVSSGPARVTPEPVQYWAILMGLVVQSPGHWQVLD